MSVKGEIKEGAAFVKEAMHEHGKSPESQRKAREGRNLRNEGRVEDGNAPKRTSLKRTTPKNRRDFPPRPLRGSSPEVERN